MEKKIKNKIVRWLLMTYSLGINPIDKENYKKKQLMSILLFHKTKVIIGIFHLIYYIYIVGSEMLIKMTKLRI